MRRADRLFQLTVLLGRGRILTGNQLAERLGVSRRSVYRDIADLMACGVPIDGEAGVGYRMRRGYSVPPLMFTPEELQALVFGARLVQSCADEGLHEAAEALLAKIDAVLPASLRPSLENTGLSVPDFRVSAEVKRTLRALRRAVSERRRVSFHYTQGDGTALEARVRALCLRYVGGTWTLGGWSEIDGAFRAFRVYRIDRLDVSEAHFGIERGRDLADYLAAADRLGAGF
ncbi:MAG: helix-turn-helix transcriptional regulator [Burkholderiales bacterium]